MSNFSKTSVTIGNKTVDAFVNDNQEYFYSLTSAAALIDKVAQSTSDFISSKVFKSGRGKGFQPLSYRLESVTYSLVPSWVIVEYLGHHATRNGDEQALNLLVALATESLDLRAARAFGGLTVETYDKTVQKTDKYINDWLEARRLSTGCHPDFHRACRLKRHPGSHVHDRITQAINEKTARQARQGELVAEGLDPAVGLNYVSDTTRLQAIALAKMEYCGLLKGTWQEQADRSVDISIKLLREIGAKI